MPHEGPKRGQRMATNLKKYPANEANIMMDYSHAQKTDMGKATKGAKAQPTQSTYRGGSAAPKGSGHSGSMKAHK